MTKALKTGLMPVRSSLGSREADTGLPGSDDQQTGASVGRRGHWPRSVTPICALGSLGTRLLLTQHLRAPLGLPAHRYTPSGCFFTPLAPEEASPVAPR